MDTGADRAFDLAYDISVRIADRQHDGRSFLEFLLPQGIPAGVGRVFTLFRPFFLRFLAAGRGGFQASFR